MQYLLPFLAEWPLLSLLQGAFTVWMLVDVFRRRSDTYWPWVIFMFQPLGPWIYFFAVKVKDFRGGSALAWPTFQRRPSLRELRYRVQQSPTLASHLELAERLIEIGDHQDATTHLEAVLAREPDHCPALYNLAVCRNELGHPEEAVAYLEKVIARERFWGNYRAWHLLVEARLRCRDTAGALNSCRELVRQSPTLEHKCLLAERLLDEGRTDEAWDVLERGLEDHHFAPRQVRWRNRRWASQARRLQKRIS